MSALKTLLSGASALAFVLAGAPAALAQGVEVDELVVTGSQVELAPVYAGGQVARGGRVGLFGALDVMDTPFSATNYTEELVRNQQATGVGDVLKNEPTVRVAKGFGNFQELYVVRGFPVYSDDMTYNGVYGVLPRQFVAAELIERLEVFRGANSFLNGAAPGGSGIGGAFNLVPKRAPQDPLTRATVGYETEGALYGALDVARRFGAADDFGVRLNLVKRDGETSVADQDRDLSVAALGMDYEGERLRFSADLGFQDHRIDAPRPSVTPNGAVPAAPSADSNFAQPWTFTDERQLFGVVRGEFDLNANVSLWAAVGGRDGEEENVLANPNASADGTTSAYRFDNRREDEIISADVGVRADFSTGGLEHRVVVSASAIQSKSRNAYAFSNFAGFAGDLYNPVAVAPPAANFFVGGVLSDPKVTEKVDNRSLAIADMITLMDGRLIATLGARYQEIETTTFNYNSGVQDTQYAEDAITPAVGMVFKPSDAVSVYANYAEALTPGQIAPGAVGGVPILNPGDITAPFRSKQYEAGVKYDGGTFGGTVSLFSISQPSAIVDNLLFVVDGEQVNQGIELSAFGEPMFGLRVLGGATFVDAERRRTEGGAFDGKTVIGVPEFQANLNVEYDLPTLPGLTVDGRIVHTGSQYVNAANTVSLDAWTRLDLGARYSLDVSGKPVTLRARVENVTDQDDWQSAGGYPGANYLVLGAPRTFIVSASVDF
ncbi:MAG: TonB-dependent receptor [Phenylobacterium sp.]|uniref:TonB-dependent receptor n=1 Tax=Phenylobacterium sp. TaxID=1871053 RepID=UPI002715A6E3|nr:TonB-dependent receptor [Phenylobacterium sp.]MDO8411104.1 TonB-dependent receptor [Phenylobacterium sp.]